MSVPSTPPFEARIKVRFNDVDPAGIAYYPRVVGYLHVAMEEFFDDFVGRPYADVLQKERLGFPAVHLEMDFLRPLRFGEEVAVEMRVKRLGRTSMEVGHRLRGPDGTARASATLTVVCVHLDTLEPTPFPPAYRAAFERAAAHGPEGLP